ncbi:phage terminase large subunit [Spongiimicrobium salis]|uniref:phage terminase large subunit n=1 Tax=Spongiimicrobium salis TaxID=1667022 RepID=UPI00374CC741
MGRQLDVTVVWQKNFQAINRRMLFVSLEGESDEHYNCKVYAYSDIDENFDYVDDYEFEKKVFDYEPKKIHHSEEITGYICFHDQEHEELKKTYVNEAKRVLSDHIQNRYKYINNTGSSRSSKTYSIIDIIDWYCKVNSNKRATAWRDTKKSCKDTVLKDFLKRLKTTGRFIRKQFNKSESYYVYGDYDAGDETTFEIHGGDDDETVHGLTQDLAWLNEPYNISQETFDQIDQRTSDFLIFDLNPKTKHWSDTISKNWRCKNIYSTFRDNPFCPREQKRKILSYQPVSYAQVVVDGKISLQDLYGYDLKENKFLFSKSEINEIHRCKENERSINGSKPTANAYMWEVYGLGIKSEKPNKIYSKWKKISVSEYLALPYDEFYGLDFGQANPTAIAGIKYNDGTFYFHELLYKPEREMENGLIHELERIGVDKSAQMICDSANPEKILELRKAGYNAMPAFKNAGSVFSGISLIQRANVCYTGTSSSLEGEYDEYSWDSDRLGILDKPIKKNDHLLDAIRYCVSYLAIKLAITI